MYNGIYNSCLVSLNHNLGQKIVSLLMATASGGSFNDEVHCCEVCGLTGISSQELTEHIQIAHTQGISTCPFCDMVDPSPEVMMIHVNEAHLDYLSPQVWYFIFSFTNYFK